MVSNMSNKDVFKELYSEYFNKEKNYHKIVDSIERDKTIMNKYLKWSFVPICLIAIISGVLIFNNNKELKPNIYKPNIETKDDVNIYINDVSQMISGALKSDADVKIINNISIPYFEEIGNIVVPKDFDNNHNAYAIYVKPDRNSDEYNILQSYVFNYSNTKNDRHIRVSFSKENKPIRDYYFSEEGSKISRINNIELKLFKYNESYFTEFNYKGINFDIETNSITEEELTNLLLSIIK